MLCNKSCDLVIHDYSNIRVYVFLSKFLLLRLIQYKENYRINSNSEYRPALSTICRNWTGHPAILNGNYKGHEGVMKVQSGGYCSPCDEQTTGIVHRVDELLTGRMELVPHMQLNLRPRTVRRINSHREVFCPSLVNGHHIDDWALVSIAILTIYSQTRIRDRAANRHSRLCKVSDAQTNLLKDFIFEKRLSIKRQSL